MFIPSSPSPSFYSSVLSASACRPSSPSRTRRTTITCSGLCHFDETAQPMLPQPTHISAFAALLRRLVRRSPDTTGRSSHATAKTLGARLAVRQPPGGRQGPGRRGIATGYLYLDWRKLAARCLRRLEAPLESATHQFRDSYPASAMLQGSIISNQKTLYEVLSVGEDATYDEIRAAYKSAALNTHPDKAQTALKSYVSSNAQQDFFSVQKAWEILCHPESRAEYDKQMRSSRQNLEIIATDIEIEDMIVESTADAVELLYACRCGDYFSITSCELGEMGILVSEDGEIELRASDSLSTSVVLGCGSCSLKTRLVINKTS